MKHKLIAIIILINLCAAGYGAVNLNIALGYNSAGDLKNQYSSGAELAVGIMPGLGIFAFGMMSSTGLTGPKEGEDFYSYTAFGGGVQYIMPFNFFRLSWINTLGAGDGIAYSKVYTKTVSDKYIEMRENGLMVQYRTGILYEWSQFVSPYIEVGYQMAFYKSYMSDLDVSGFQVMMGARLCLFGLNKSISNQY